MNLGEMRLPARYVKATDGVYSAIDGESIPKEDANHNEECQNADEELLTEGRRLEAATRRHPVPPHVIGSRVHQCTSAMRAIRASLRRLKAADPSSPLFTEQQVAQMVDRSTPRDRESDEAAKILRMTVNHMHEPVRRELVPAARVGRSPVFSSKDEERIAVHRNETKLGLTPNPRPEGKSKR